MLVFITESFLSFLTLFCIISVDVLDTGVIIQNVSCGELFRAAKKQTGDYCMSKLFTVVGVSRIRERDAMKLRVANGGAEGRAKRLTRGGHVEVVLFDTKPMNKQQALDWLELTHPQLAAQIGSKQVSAVRAKVAKAAKKTATKVEAPVAVEPKVEVTDVALSLAAKMALKRARDAARKREKRAAEKVAKQAAVA